MSRERWTAERDAELTRLAAENLTYSQIGKQLGISKNAAIGRARRLGLPRRYNLPSKPHIAKTKSVRVRELVAAVAPHLAAARVNAVAPQTSPLPPLSSAEGCRFITAPDYLALIRDGKYDKIHCGKPRVDGHSWCAEHYRIVYISAEEAHKMETAA
jgi:GcrA cell cycle regulator